MDLRLADRWAQMEERKAEFVACFTAFDPTDRTRRPPKGGWSPLEVAEHVVIVDGNVVSALAKEPSPDRPRVVQPGRWVRLALMRTAFELRVRIRAPVPAILPTGAAAWEELAGRWEAQRMALRRWLDQVQPD